MQYTPGPWFIVDNEIRPTISGPLIAIINHSGRKQEIAEGNENLIAATPDMYEALDEALNALLGCAVPAGGIDDRKHIIEAQQRARKALAKANGDNNAS